VIEKIRSACQGVRRQPGASFTLIVVLALTAGVTAASLEIIGAFLWRPLPYPGSERLVVVDYPRQNGPSPTELQAIDGRSVSAFAELAVASDPDSFTVLGGDAPFTIDGRWTSGDVFAMFGVVPVLGRVFTPEESSRGEPLAVIGYHVWQERFGGRADIIGRSITVRATIRRGEAETFTIAGVLPRRFWHVEDRTSLILPLKGSRLPWLMRLRDQVSAEQAAARISAIVRQAVPRVAPEWSAVVRSARDTHVDRVRPMLAVTGWGVLLIAGVALANLSFLQMARGVRRQRESAVRSVLGASGRTLALQAVAESVVIGVVASLLSLIVTLLLLQAGMTPVEQYVGRLIPTGIAPLGRGAGLWTGVPIATIVASIVLGLIMHAVSVGATPVLALAGTASTTDTPWRLAIRQLIVTVQVAVAFCLLVGAALMARTTWNLGHQDLGFNATGVLSANLTLHEGTYRSIGDRREFVRTLIAELERLPEVAHAGLTGWLPFRVGPAITIEIDGATGVAPIASLQGVNPQYLEALQLRLREGRFIDESDRSGRDNAAVISESLARAAWGANSPIGRQFRIKFSPAPGRGFGPYIVVGVVGDVMQSLMHPTPPQLYVAFDQQPLATNAFLQLRTRSLPGDAAPTVARIVRDMNPELALGSIQTLEEIVDAEGLRPRLLATALAAFATLSMAIAVIGLFAVSSWIARLGQREAALRMALGADRASVAVLLARRGLIAIAAGIVVGWIAAMPLSASIASELRGVAASDASTRVVVALLLTAVSTCALFGPAWRASTTELAALLKRE
jgi:putative ABC transport system permease protein